MPSRRLAALLLFFATLAAGGGPSSALRAADGFTLIGSLSAPGSASGEVALPTLYTLALTENAANFNHRPDIGIHLGFGKAFGDQSLIYRP